MKHENIMKRCASHFVTGSAAVFFFVAGIFSPEVSATTIFEYESSCVTHCDEIGLTADDPVGGTIGFNDAAVAAGIAGLADVESFNVTFGIFTFGLPSLDVRIVDGSEVSGFASALFDAAGVVSFDFSFITSAHRSDPGYIFSETAWNAGPSASRQAVGGAGTLTAVVPLPGAIWLFGSGLLGMIGIARRKEAA